MQAVENKEDKEEYLHGGVLSENQVFISLCRHPRSLLIGDLSPNIQALPTQGKDARLLPRA